MRTEVAIAGGGLAGLALAARLHAAGVDFRLFEARARLGGRIAALDTPAGRVDLGPSWFWPGQPHIARLAADLRLRAFPQHSAGAACFEDDRGTIHRGFGFASMAGTFRLEGGMTGLIEGLAAHLPPDRLCLSSRVAAVLQPGGVLTVDGRRCEARHVVLALPLRVAATLRFHPALPSAVTTALEAVPTWMAGHAKFVAVYDRPFWRTRGLSGDAVSRLGPLAEIHDASGPEGRPAALFGFLGVPATQRSGRAEETKAAALRQLARIFGPPAMSPLQTVLRDWAADPETATGSDQVPPPGHPAYSLPPALPEVRGHRLHFAATETSPDMGGLMEGALISAERVANDILGASGRERPT